MNSNVTATYSGEVPFIYNKKTQEVVMEYKNFNLLIGDNVNLKITVKPTKLINHKSNYVDITLYSANAKSDSNYSEVAFNRYPIEHILQNIYFKFEPFPLRTHVLLSYHIDFRMAFNETCRPFRKDFYQYLFNLMFGKGIFKKTTHELRSHFKTSANGFKLLLRNLLNKKINNQEVLQKVADVSNSNKYMSNNAYKWRVKMGIHTIGDSKFIEAKNKAYDINGFNNLSKLSFNPLKNYFVEINDKKHEITPVSSKTIYKLIKLLINVSLMNLKHTTSRDIQKYLIA